MQQFAQSFDNAKSIALSEIGTIKRLLDNSHAIETIDKSKKKLEEEIKEYSVKIAKHTTEREALDQQFVDERKTPTKVKKPRVMVLQDYILAAFIISYILVALVGIAYVTSHGNSMIRSLLLSTAVFFVLGAIIYSAVLYIA